MVDLGGERAEDEVLVGLARAGDREFADDPAGLVEHRRQDDPAGRGIRAVRSDDSQASAPGPVTRYLA